MSPRDWVSERVFNLVHRHNLVYNTCWEDPRLDRVALDIGTDDSIMVITSAGCNALDYVLCNPRHVHAVDMNPPQNALLELKLAGIKQLDFQTFFAMFGRGQLDGAREVYHRTLRRGLSDGARSYWDRHIQFFARAQRRPFYFRGTSGTFAKLVNVYIDRIVFDDDEMTLVLRLEEVMLKLNGDAQTPVAALIKSGALDLSNPGSLVGFMPNKSPVIAEAKDNRITLDLMRDPRIGQNPMVRSLVAVLTSLVTLRDIESDDEHLEIGFRALPAGFRGAARNLRRHVIMPSIGKLLPR